MTSDTVQIHRCDLCLPTDDLLDLADERITRDPTEAERARYGL